MFACLIASSGGCARRKSDEDLLREKIDCTAVHLYVASKIAIFRAPTDPSVQNARAQLESAMHAAERIVLRLDPRDGGVASGDGGAPLAAPSVDLADVRRLAVALWNLRAEGARVVRSGREDELQPILPKLFKLGETPPPWVDALDVNTEHAVLFLGLLFARFDERVPVPIPPEVILYEGSRVDVERVQLDGMKSALNAARAYVYASHGLCDLASRDASAIDARRWDPAAMRRSYATLSGDRPLSDEQARRLDGAFRMVSHGASAACYGKRGDDAPMKEELRRFIDGMHALGAEREETGVLRAFLSFENNDVPSARAALADARRMRDLDESTRREIDAMDRALASGDRGAIRRQFDRGKLALLTARVVRRQLARTGVFDAIGETATMRKLRAFVSGTSGAIDVGRRTLDATAHDAQQRTRGWFDRLRR